MSTPVGVIFLLEARHRYFALPFSSDFVLKTLPYVVCGLLIGSRSCSSEIDNDDLCLILQLCCRKFFSLFFVWDLPSFPL
uniref:Uncharacterized protein n=1 Tax=Oryza punctata TaxID=4537 RepID=A0A0E0LZS5_ORYPU